MHVPRSPLKRMRRIVSCVSALGTSTASTTDRASAARVMCSPAPTVLIRTTVVKGETAWRGPDTLQAAPPMSSLLEDAAQQPAPNMAACNNRSGYTSGRFRYMMLQRTSPIRPGCLSNRPPLYVDASANGTSTR